MKQQAEAAERERYIYREREMRGVVRQSKDAQYSVVRERRFSSIEQKEGDNATAARQGTTTRMKSSHAGRA